MGSIFGTNAERPPPVVADQEPPTTDLAALARQRRLIDQARVGRRSLVTVDPAISAAGRNNGITTPTARPSSNITIGNAI